MNTITKYVFCASLFVSMCTTCQVVSAQTASAKIEVPDWALPGSKTHKQVPPPKDFHRPARTVNKSIGIFKGQSDVGGALVAGSSSYNKKTKQYTITSAGYNVWYTRDEFRYLWKKMSGDVSFAADISFPDTAGYFDRKAVLVIRQSLDDDSKEVMVALHGGGLLHLAWRPEQNENIKEHKAKKESMPDKIDKRLPTRIGLQKRGDSYAIFVSINGEPMHEVADPVELKLDAPFYVGIGFCSHIPDVADTAVLSNVILENSAGKMK